MSTRCNIGIENADGTITFVYCHWDGYPETPGVGAQLLQYYATEGRVRELLSGGSLSQLAPNCGPPPNGHKYGSAHEVEGFCVYYIRDRGEQVEDHGPWTEPRKQAVRLMDGEYTYLFGLDGCWKYRDHEAPFAPLTPAVCGVGVFDPNDTTMFDLAKSG